jgi:hypothetical protein
MIIPSSSKTGGLSSRCAPLSAGAELLAIVVITLLFVWLVECVAISQVKFLALLRR